MDLIGLCQHQLLLQYQRIQHKTLISMNKAVVYAHVKSTTISVTVKSKKAKGDMVGQSAASRHRLRSGHIPKQDNVHMNTESVQCISTLYSIICPYKYNQ